MSKKNNIPVHRPKTEAEFQKLNNELNSRRFVAIDALKPGILRSITLGGTDPANAEAQDFAANITAGGSWCTGPLRSVAWCFNDRNNNKPVAVSGKDGKPLGLGYIPWGPADNLPSVVPVLAKSLPYTAAPLRYIADLTAGLGPKLMYRFPDGELVEFRDAGERLRQEVDAEEQRQREELQAEEDRNTYHGVHLLKRTTGVQGFKSLRVQDVNVNGNGNLNDQTTNLPISQTTNLPNAQSLYDDWYRTWYGYDMKEENGSVTHIPGAKEFLDDNNLNLHLSQCMQDDVMLDMYFPTVGLQRGRRGAWKPKIVRLGVLKSDSVRYECMNEYRHINHVYFSDLWRTKGIGGDSIPSDAGYVLYPTAMPEHMLSDLNYIIESNQRTRIKDRPTWIVCPTFYPSGGPYYQQPAWWSVFTSKAFDFSSTILYDKAKQRENITSWGKIMYISLDYLDQIFSQEGYQGQKDKQEQFIGELENNMEQFLQHRENHGKMMRQWMWLGQDGKEHHNVEIVDIAETTNDAVKAGKEELELSTSPIFLALQVDPRLVGVPMVAASNGGTALREMHLLKQQQLSVKQRLYLNFLNTISKFNEWSDRAEWVIKQQTLTTLDNSKTGTVETVSGREA